MEKLINDAESPMRKPIGNNDVHYHFSTRELSYVVDEECPQIGEKINIFQLWGGNDLEA